MRFSFTRSHVNSALGHTPPMQDEAPIDARPFSSSARPYVAAVASVLLPGAGQALVGAFGRGVVIAAVAAAIGVAALWAFLHVATVLGLFGPLVLALAWRIWAGRDAYRLARSSTEVTSRLRAAGLLILLIVASLVLSIPFDVFERRVLGEAWRMPSASMSPRLVPGDRVITSPLHRAPARGDIVVFLFPEDTTKTFVKRVVGTPGDTLRMIDKALVVNGTRVSEPYAHHAEPDIDPVTNDFAWQLQHLVMRSDARYRPSRNNWGPLVVAPNTYFVLGDDRDNSLDSRWFGFVARELIRSMPQRIYFSRDSVAGIQWRRIGAFVQ